MIMPTVQTAMKTASSLGFTAFRSMIIDGSDRVVTPHHKGQHNAQQRSLCKQRFGYRYRAENIRVHWDPCSDREQHAKRIAAAKRTDDQ